MKKLKFLPLAIGAVVLVALVILLDYALPEQRVVHITGVEVKRMDDDGVINAENPADGPTRDVYMIYTATPDSGEIRVYRNEDTRFGFPFYFKFDSADVQARAQALSRDAKQLTVIKSYGWRLSMLSSFPNATSVSETDSPDAPFPIFNTLFILLLLGGGTWGVLKVRKLMAARG